MIGNETAIERLLVKARRSLKERFNLSHRDWMDAVEVYTRSRPLIVKGDYTGSWRHPWHTVCRWNLEREEWEMNINAGFVHGTNGAEVEIKTLTETAPEATLERIGKTEDKTVNAYLTEEPFVSVKPSSLRAIGPDAEPTGTTSRGLTLSINYEAVPEYFVALGVGTTPKQELSLTGGFTETFNLADQENEKDIRRLLRATELNLSVDRLAASTSWTQGAGIDGTYAQFDVGYAADPSFNDNAQVYFSREFKPQAQTPFEDRLQGNWQDDPFDKLHLATIYFMSPQGAKDGAAVDGTWQPFIKHRIFWNLNHTTNRLKPPPESTNLIVPIPLAGGIAQPLANTITAALNDSFDAISEFLSNRGLEGRFWST